MQERLNAGMPRSPSTFGARLKVARTKRELSQGALAIAAGLKQPDISKMELGLIQQTTGMARLASALNVPALWLELGDGPEPDWGSPGEARVDFEERKVSDSGWAILQDIEILPHEERQRLVDELAARAKIYREYEKQVVAKMKGQAAAAPSPGEFVTTPSRNSKRTTK